MGRQEWVYKDAPESLHLLWEGLHFYDSIVLFFTPKSDNSRKEEIMRDMRSCKTQFAP